MVKFNFRRDRNFLRINGNVMAQPFGSREPRTRFLCSCQPSSTRRSSERPTTCSAMMVFLVVTVAAGLLSLAYFAVNLQSQVAVLSMHLEAGKPT